MLELKAVQKSFGGLAAIRNVSIRIEDGEILGLIGPNGSGKSTLFNLISGLIRPDSGRIVFRGKDITGAGPHEICREGIGRTFQLVKPFARMTALRNVMVGRSYGSDPALDMGEAERQAGEILDRVGLSQKKRIVSTSLGLLDRKRLELARALATRPKLLLLDEIMAGLNPIEIETAMRLLSEVRASGVTLIVIEHVMKAVLGISDRIVVLSTGRVIADGLPQEVIRHEGVIEAYLGTKGNA
ncbi:MAG: ABC transporter ATP-binding protein [Thermodesulfobacteriota bacterium]